MKENSMYEMKACGALIKRNVHMFFKDKGTFFTSLITPIILLVLYATFLYNVYEDSFASAFPPGTPIDEELLSGLVGGLLLASLLAVSGVTVPFCANLFMVQDKVTGSRNDFSITPIKPHSIAISYYFATVINGLIVCFVALGAGLIYLACIGWYLSLADVGLLFLDVVLLVLFGTALSSVICYPLQSQGAMSAVGTIVSAGYGFICGAYMPLSQFSVGLRNALGFLPGTYATSLIKTHALQGVCEEFTAQGFPVEAVKEIKDVADCNLYFFGNAVQPWVSYAVLIGAIVLLVGAFVLMNILSARTKTKREK